MLRGLLEWGVNQLDVELKGKWAVSSLDRACSEDLTNSICKLQSDWIPVTKSAGVVVELCQGHYVTKDLLDISFPIGNLHLDWSRHLFTGESL